MFRWIPLTKLELQPPSTYQNLNDNRKITKDIDQRAWKSNIDKALLTLIDLCQVSSKLQLALLQVDRGKRFTKAVRGISFATVFM